MDTQGCGHVAVGAISRACLHLLVEEPPTQLRQLTGRRMEYDLLCRACAGSGAPESHLVSLCEGCADRLDEECDDAVWLGEPEILIADVEQPGRWSTTPCPAVPLNERCVAPLPNGWLVLTVDGLVALDGDGAVRDSVTVAPADEENPGASRARGAAGPELITSEDGAFAAVVNNQGQYGILIDLATGRTVAQFDRGNYHSEWTPFPLAFVRCGHTTQVIAATAWNRLEMFDAATGTLLTAFDENASPGGRPGELFLYHVFHGRLTPCPAGRRLLDDAWAWSPAGLPTVIDLEEWLGGQTQLPLIGLKLAQRWHAWDQPVAWIDEATVAVQRIGTDDEAMIDGVELYDATDGRRVGMFAGPAGRMWGHRGSLFVVAAHGLEVWGRDGVRAGVIDGFTPTAFAPRTETFAQLTDGVLRTWRPTLANSRR